MFLGLLWLLLPLRALQSQAPEPSESGQTELRAPARLDRQRRFLAARSQGAGVSCARALDAARREHLRLGANPLAQAGNANLAAAWTAVGPAQVASVAFGDVTGRVTSLVIDPSDASGNTLYVGTTGGGVWKSTNAVGPPAAVVFSPLTDTLPVFNSGAGSSSIASLSIGALGLGDGVLLAGTGDPNDATDSYYGAGILRSTDGGVTWTLVQQSSDGAAGNHSFFGLSFAGFAFSSINPAIAVAAVSRAAEGDLVNAPDASASAAGLYSSSDAGLTWHMATLLDGSQVVQGPGYGGSNPATSVVWNPLRQRFYAAVRSHGYYESSDGITWNRLAHQPGAGLTNTACPAATVSPACPIFRGALAVQSTTGDLFALTVDFANHDEGLYQDVCAASGSACAGSSVLFGNRLGSAPLEVGNGSNVIGQADYNLALATIPSGTDTLLFAGTIDLYRCSLAAGCSFRNTTNAENGCGNRAGVAPAQHAIAALPVSGGVLLYLGNDGGLYRSTDGVAEAGPVCSATDASHFQNLNAGLGSLAEVVSFAQDPIQPSTLLAGLGALGSAGTGSASSPWLQLSTGEGGSVAIDQSSPLNWYISTGAGVNIAQCSKGTACRSPDFMPAIGAAQTTNDLAAIHAPFLLDPRLTNSLILGTCRVWRGPASGGALWSSANAISAPFGAPSASGCSSTFPVVRSLAAGGPVSASLNAQNAGSTVIYAGIAGSLDGGNGFGGHLFTTASADVANATTAWTDAARSPVSNDAADAGVFNPGGFDVSSVAVDSHDTTGKTVYATVMGFAGNGKNSPHVYRSIDGGSHWTNISSNLPNAPANSIVVDPNDANTLYVALDTGVYVTSQVSNCANSNCWSIYGTSLPNAPVIQLIAGAALPTGDGRAGELRAATYGRGIWQIPLITAISPAAPVLTLAPVSVTYSAQQVGSLSANVTVTVTNNGNAVLTVSSVVTVGDFVSTNTCVGMFVNPGQSCAVQIAFLPTVVGPRTGQLTVYGNAAGGQATALLSGIATAPAAVLLTPSALTFAATTVGASSAAQNITISNTGGSAVQLASQAVSGDFQITANTCGATLPAGVGCTVSVVFAPTANGTRSGTFSVVDDAGTQVASLSGTGTSPATDTLNPTSLSFSAQQLNTFSTLQQVTLTNAGDVALTLIAAQVTSGDFTVVNGCGTSLAPHSSCALSIGFAPKSVGNQTGSVAISDVSRSQTVLLSGVGVAPPGVSLSPVNGLGFSATGVGLSATIQTVTLTNNGGALLTLGNLTITGDFYVYPGSNTCGTTVAPAAVCSVGVGFTPTASGIRNGNLTITSNATTSPQSAALTGIGVDFNFAPNGPTSLSISSGQAATYALLLGSGASLPGSVSFTCAGVPAHALCTVNPASSPLSGNSVISVTVATGLSSAAIQPPAWPALSGRAVWFALVIPCLPLLGRRKLRHSLACLCVTLVLLGGGGCSAGRTLPSVTGTLPTSAVTPSGTYTLLVAGSSAGLVRSVDLTLVVQ